MEPVFREYAGDTSLTFAVTEDAVKAGTFFIDLKKGAIHANAQWFEDEGYSREQFLWACLHEMEHFLDMKSSPREFLAHFESMRQKDAVYGGIKPFHTLYNVLDDVKVNTSVAKRAGFAYKDKDSAMGGAVRELYTTKLFPKIDFTRQPLHLQFVYALLREEMLGEECLVAPRVRALVDGDIQVGGNAMPLKVFLREMSTHFTPAEFLRKRSEKEVLEAEIAMLHKTAAALPQVVFKQRLQQKERELRAVRNYLDHVYPPDKRYALVEKFIEPLYRELLEADKQEKSPEQMEQAYSEMEKGDFHGFSDEELQRIVERFQEMEEARDTAAQPVAQPGFPKQMPSQDPQAPTVSQQLDEKYHIPAASRSEYERVRREVEGFLPQMRAAFEQVVQESREVTREPEGHFRKGARLDIRRLIRAYPGSVVGQPESVAPLIFERWMPQLEQLRKPRNIRVHMLVDLSSSMKGEAAFIQEQCVVLIQETLRLINLKAMELRAYDQELAPALTTESQVIGFGTETLVIKPMHIYTAHSSTAFTETLEQDLADTVKAMGALQNPDMNETKDAQAIEGVLDSIDEGRQKEAEEGEVLDVVFHFTDGGSHTKEASHTAVQRLVRSHAHVFGFQLGSPGTSDEETFRYVFDDRGMQVPDISALPYLVQQVLWGVIRSIRL